MDDLVQWLGEQLAAVVAKAPQWHDLECEIHTHLNGGLLATVAASRMLDEVPGAVCDCGGPARVLRETDAKRRLTALHTRAHHQCVTEDGPTQWHAADPCTTLRLLALLYSDSSGYREE